MTSASRTLGASMAPVTSPGSASVRPTGVASSATKVRSLGTGPWGRTGGPREARENLSVGGGVIGFLLLFIFICRGFSF